MDAERPSSCYWFRPFRRSSSGGRHQPATRFIAPVACMSRAVDALAVFRDLQAKPGRRAWLRLQLCLFEGNFSPMLPSLRLTMCRFPGGTLLGAGCRQPKLISSHKV